MTKVRTNEFGSSIARAGESWGSCRGLIRTLPVCPGWGERPLSRNERNAIDALVFYKAEDTGVSPREVEAAIEHFFGVEELSQLKAWDYDGVIRAISSIFKARIRIDRMGSPFGRRCPAHAPDRPRSKILAAYGERKPSDHARIRLRRPVRRHLRTRRCPRMPPALPAFPRPAMRPLRLGGPSLPLLRERRWQRP
jgi:hypothetical protein